MSSILESVLDDERRAACKANDERMAANEPIRPMPRVAPQAKAEPFFPVSVLVKMAMCAVLCGIGMGLSIGQLVGHTNRPAVRYEVDKDKVMRVPGVKIAPTTQRVEV